MDGLARGVGANARAGTAGQGATLRHRVEVRALSINGV
jgi:hypothetical protein